jgi:4-diphosphocytidyl-2-C-methyl-D-erythritol kinase
MTEVRHPEEDEGPGSQSLPGAVKVRVPAKINLHLGVGPLRPDGYHELNTVYHAIALYDELTARRGDTLTLTMEGEGAGELALDESNLVIRAARALAEYAGVPAHARLHLRKRIPLAGGLAGGSADAAAALVACDALWGTGLGRDQLATIAAGLGSDVPFLLHGGTALGTGRGETVNPILVPPVTWHWVVAVAEGGISTPQAYRELDRLRDQGLAPAPLDSTDTLLAALRDRDPVRLGRVLGNDLEAAALSLRPELAVTLEAGRAAGALAGIVSGSGPTCVFLAADVVAAGRIIEGVTATGCCRRVESVIGPVPGARVC